MTTDGPPSRSSDAALPGCVTIRCRQGGPLVVELPEGVRLRVVDHEGGECPPPANKPLVALCRCGASRAKPYCDGSHRVTGFGAEGQGPGAGLDGGPR